MMYPHERLLMQKYKGKKFVIVGVNSDSNREKLKKVLQKEKITWRNWFDGRRGAISTKWRIISWPTTYVLDRNGIIRHKNVRGEALDKAIAEVMAEIDK